MNPDGSGQAWLHHGSEPVWSADAQSLLFVRGGGSTADYSLYKMPADGSSETLLFQGAALPPFQYCYYHSPDWSPDGTRIVTAFNQGCEEHDVPLSEMYVAAADGSGKTRLPVLGWSPSWHPNGSEIAYVKVPPGSGSGEGVHAIHPDGTGQRVIWAQPMTPTGDPIYNGVEVDYSPDGTKLVFSAARSVDPVNGQEIFVVSASGGTAVQLTANTVTDDFPVWSPDGTKIAFSSRRDGNWEIYTMNANGTNQTRITNDPGDAVRCRAGSRLGAPGTRAPRAPPRCACRSCPPTGSAPRRTAPRPAAGLRLVQRAGSGVERARPLSEAPVEHAGFMRFDTHRRESLHARRRGRHRAAGADHRRARAGHARPTTRARSRPRRRCASPTAPRAPGTPPPRPTCRSRSSRSALPRRRPRIGSTCSLDTTLDTLIPGAIAEGQRTIMQLSQVQVIDGGADGDTATEPNNRVPAPGPRSCPRPYLQGKSERALACCGC